MSSLRRGHANLLCIVPILVYVEQVNSERAPNLLFIPHFSSWPRNHTHRGSFFSKDIPLMTTVFNFWEFFLFFPAQLVKTQLIMTSVFHITRVRKKQTAVTNWLQYVNEDSIWKQNIRAYPWWDSNPQSLNYKSNTLSIRPQGLCSFCLRRTDLLTTLFSLIKKKTTIYPWWDSNPQSLN